MDMHDGLERAGEAQTRDSAERLGSADVRALLDSRVRRGRQRRDAGIGTVAAVAVGAIALGAANLPGWGGGTANPAATPTALAPSPDGAYEFGEPYVVVGQDLRIECGEGFSDVPVVVHDESVLSRGLTLDYSVEGWQPELEADGGPLIWHLRTSHNGDGPDLEWRAVPVAVHGTSVVGLGIGGGWSGGGAGTSGFDENAPLPGDCRPDENAQLDGDYTQALLVQVLDHATEAPLITFTMAEGVTYTGLADFWKDQGVTFAESPDGPAELRAPEGDTYQAFVVPRPEQGSCTPLSDQRAAGQPGLHSIQYEVTIPRVQRLTNDLWSVGVVVSPGVSKLDAWYVGRDAWLVADDSGDMGESGLSWSTDPQPGEPLIEHTGNLRLIGGSLGTSLAGEDCIFLARLDPVKGAVFLVIDGVDWETVEREYPTMSWATTDLLTWVYLGQAE